MRYAVVGGDMRFAYLADMLRESGREVHSFLLEKAGTSCEALSELGKCSCAILNWPMRWPFAAAQTCEEEVLGQFAAGTRLLCCGPGFPDKTKEGFKYYNLWKDETLLQENAYLTAEAAVGCAMQSSQRALIGLDVMVVGLGRIGRALMEILLNLGAKVTVVSRDEKKRRDAAESGAAVAAPEETLLAIRGKKIVFSTPPALVIGRKVLEQADADVLLIDLASSPYGIDLQAAQDLNLRAWREPGLPGRSCPMSAARALCNALIRWEEAVQHG